MAKGNRDGWKNAPNNQRPQRQSDSIAFIRELVTWPAIDLRDPEAMLQRFNDYTDLCERYKSRVLVSGLCNSMGLTRDDVLAWSKGKNCMLNRVLSPESASMLKNILRMLEVDWEFAMQNNGYRNPVTGIFLGKNNFGYSDESVNVVKHEESDRGPSREALQAKYQAALPDDPIKAEVDSVETIYELPDGEKKR